MTRKFYNIHILFLSFIFTLSSLSAQESIGLYAKAKDDGIEIYRDGKAVFFYQTKTKSLDGQYPRANYIHPLYGLNGEVLTEDFPEDHLHQRGIFWAWHQMIVEDQWMADQWDCRGISWEVDKLKTKSNQSSLEIHASINWLGMLPSKSREEKLFREKTIIKVNGERSDAIEIEFDISITANYLGSKLGGSNDEKGYGGFSARLKLPEDISFHAKQGVVEAQNTAVEAGNWISFHGTFAPDASVQSRITIMNHPDNPSPFQGWILREKNSMQNPAWPGRHSVFFVKGKPTRLRYKLLIHDEMWTKGMIEENFRKFVQSP
ncbi:MAG: DUF6807 family protein [Bacteroidia bacterium]|nr:DUF6807 family protein [Bacteroidia bacterium]